MDEILRLKVLKRDDFTCQSCFGSNQEGFMLYDEQTKYLHVHHKYKTPQSVSERIDDLVTVCDSCHKGEDNRITSKRPRNIWIEESTREELNKMASSRCATYNDVILALIDFWNKNRSYALSHYDTQGGNQFTFKQDYHKYKNKNNYVFLP